MRCPNLFASISARGLAGALLSGLLFCAAGAPEAQAQAQGGWGPVGKWASHSPDGGSRIVNQAVVVYEDADGLERRVTTNEVALVVQPVYSGHLSASQSRSAVPGGEAYFIHRLENTSNSSSGFCISADDAGSSQISRVRIHLDRNYDLRLDPDDELLYDSRISTAHGLIHLERNEGANLIYVVEVAPTTTAADLISFEAVARVAPPPDMTCLNGRVFTPAHSVFDANANTLLVVDTGVVEATKTSEWLSNGPGLADDQIRYTVTMTNRGLQAVADLRFDDVPLGQWVYVPGSVVSDPPGFPLRPAIDEFGNPLPDGLYMGGLGESLPAGATLTVTFLATPPAGYTRGTKINNFARIYGSNLTTSPHPFVESNITTDSAPPERAVQLRDTGAGADPNLNDGGDDDGVLNFEQRVSQVSVGESARFELIATNASTESEFLRFRVDSSSFPPGTIFTLHRADGVTPLTDSDGDGWHDLGVTASGAVRRVVVYARPPYDAAAAVGPYEATAQVGLASDMALTAAASLVLGEIRLGRLDIAATAGPEFNDGGLANQDPASAPAAVLTGRPGETVNQTLILANEGSVSEDGVLKIWLDEAMTIPLPEDWVVQTTVSAQDRTDLPHAGPLAPGETTSFNLSISTPANAAPGLRSFYVSVEGGASRALDVVRIDLDVSSALNGLLISPDRSASVSACGVATYVHRVENLSTTPISVRLRLLDQTAFASSIEFPTGPAGQEPTEFQPMQDVAAQFITIGSNYSVYEAATGGWITRSLYWNGSSVPMSLELHPGDWTLVRLRVFAPCSAPEGARDVATLIAESAIGPYSSSVQDITIVGRTSVTLEKAGAPDLDCDETPDAAFATGGVIAPPGACVIWRLTASNLGQEPVCDVRLTDDAPEFTVLQGSPVIVSLPHLVGGSCSASGASILCQVGSPFDIDGDGGDEAHCLHPGESAEARFTVRIQ